MDTLMSILSLTFVIQVVRISIPYILAALGGLVSERSGVITIALEGMLLNGAFAAVLATSLTNQPLLGVLAGICAGALTGLLHGIVTIHFQADQIISGVAFNLLAVGLTKFLLRIFYDSSSNSSRIEGLGALSIMPGDGSLAALVNQTLGHPLVWITVGLVLLLHSGLFKTVWGLRVRAIGEHPEAADTLGVKVNAMRFGAVLLCGALAGLGGVWLAMDQHQFTDGMSNGRGFIAMAAIIFGRWNPIGATLACLLFGCAEALQITLQTSGTQVPTQFIQMLPYLLTMIALAGLMGHSRPPAALGKPYQED